MFMSKKKEIYPGDPDPVELELETMKYMTVDGLAFSVANGDIKIEQAETMLDTWFTPDKIAMASLYKRVSVLRSRDQGSLPQT